MILKKDDLPKKSINKKFNKGNKYLINKHKEFNFNKKIIQNNISPSIKEVLIEKIFSKNYNNIHDKFEFKQSNNSNQNNNMLKRNNINSVKTRNKIVKNQTKDNEDNFKGIITDFSFPNNVLYNNLYSLKKDKKKMKQKNASMELRYQKANEELLSSDFKDEENKKNIIYSRPYRCYSPVSQVKKNFENQFNIKDAKNILNINYFYDKNENNYENVEDLFYTNYSKYKLRKNIKENKYNSLIINEQMNRYAKEIPSKTFHTYYIKKNPVNSIKHINYNFVKDDIISKNEPFNNEIYIETEDKNHRIKSNRVRHHSMLERNENNHYSPDRYYTNTMNNYNKFDQNNKKIIRRNGNKIQILKKNNNTSIQEYNLSLGQEDDSENDIESYENEITTGSKNKRNKIMIFENQISKKAQELNDLKKYYQYFTKNIKPININHFEIKNTKAKINIPNQNYINVNKVHNNSFQKRNILTNKKNNSNINKLVDKNKNSEGTPNFSETGKTPKNNNILFNQKIKTLDYNENEESKLKQKTSNINDLLKICQNEKFEITKQTNDESKFVFNNEDDLIEYLYNKFEEERKKKNYFNRKLRFTGFVLTKKYKGKNLSDIRIEDNIEQINQQIKNENILINDKRVEFRYIEEINKISILEEENKLLKEENENLRKIDINKNELIKKLDSEKQNLNEEINKLKKEIESLKETHN